MFEWQPKQIDLMVFLSVEVCGDGDEANDGSGGEEHPRGIWEFSSSGMEVVARSKGRDSWLSSLRSPWSNEIWLINCRMNNAWRAYYIDDSKWRLHFQFGVAFWWAAFWEVYFKRPKWVWRTLKTLIWNTAKPPSNYHLLFHKRQPHCLLITCFHSSVRGDFWA